MMVSSHMKVLPCGWQNSNQLVLKESILFTELQIYVLPCSQGSTGLQFCQQGSEPVNTLECICERELHPEAAVTKVFRLLALFIFFSFFIIPASFFEVYLSSVAYESFEGIFLFCKQFIFMQREQQTTFNRECTLTLLTIPVTCLLS